MPAASDWITLAEAQEILATANIHFRAETIGAWARSGRLQSIRENPTHAYRQLFDEWVRDFVLRLQTEPALKERGEEIKQYLLNDDTFGNYVGSLWGSLKAWLSQDLRNPESVFHRSVAAGGTWLGEQLTQDPELRQALRSQLEEAATRLAPDFAEFLTRHVRDTVREWDGHEMAEQIELNIGKDLQAIRVNGTIVGGVIGLGLYLLTRLVGST